MSSNGRKLEILGFIPARGGSKGIPGKNTRMLAGKPLIAYSILAARDSQITRTVVSTDSPDIAKISREWGAEVPFLRAPELARDHSIIEDAIKEMLDGLKTREKYVPDLIVLLHPTAPLRQSHHIDDCINLLVQSNVDSVFSVSEPTEHPGDMVSVDSSGNVHFLLEKLLGPGKIPGLVQRQGFPKFGFINGAVYVFTISSFHRTNNRYGKNMVTYEMEQEFSIDIDSETDFTIAQTILEKQKNRPE